MSIEQKYILTTEIYRIALEKNMKWILASCFLCGMFLMNSGCGSGLGSDGTDSTGVSNPADKMIYLAFQGGDSISISDSADWNICKTVMLKKFNKANYPNITSAIFGLYINGGSSTDTVLVELCDTAGNNTMKGQTLKHTGQTQDYHESSDILSSLPSTATDLTIRIKAKVSGTNKAYIRQPMLYLMRN